MPFDGSAALEAAAWKARPCRWHSLARAFPPISRSETRTRRAGSAPSGAPLDNDRRSQPDCLRAWQPCRLRQPGCSGVPNPARAPRPRSDPPRRPWRLTSLSPCRSELASKHRVSSPDRSHAPQAENFNLNFRERHGKPARSAPPIAALRGCPWFSRRVRQHEHPLELVLQARAGSTARALHIQQKRGDRVWRGLPVVLVRCSWPFIIARTSYSVLTPQLAKMPTNHNALTNLRAWRKRKRLAAGS